MKTKPSSTPNNLLSLLGSGNAAPDNSTSKGPNVNTNKSMMNAAPHTSRPANSFQQFYESITKPFFNAALNSATTMVAGSASTKSDRSTL